jgi:hypothetical protein
MPILLWPFPTGVGPPPPLFPRLLTGKVVVLDSQHYGANIAEFQPPYVGESCALVFFVGPGLPLTQQPVLFTFVAPNGAIQVGDPNFSFIGTPDMTYYYRFPPGQSLVYLIGVGELAQAGKWKVSAITTNFFSLTYNFVVVPHP